MRRRYFVALLLTTTLFGCSFLKRTKSSIFSLETMKPSAVTNLHGAPLAIAVVELPPGLDRKEIVVRKADHQLEVRETEQWGASFRAMVLHTLAFDLASRVPEGMMLLPGASQPPTALRSIDVIFDDLAAQSDGSVLLDARWMVKQPGRIEAAHHEEIRVPLTSAASDQIAAAISRGLAELADRIVAAQPPA